MVNRVFLILILLMACFSCNYIKNRSSNSIEKLDTIVDFTTVDNSPSFKECEQLIDSDKTSCFRTSISNHFTEGLKRNDFLTNEDINETVIVVLQIDKKGSVTLKEIQSSTELQKKLSELPEVLRNIVNDIPNLFPAIKRGIPVTTIYQLPIQIQTKEK